MQRDRRRDPYPWTWERPLALVVPTVLLVAIGIHLGRGIANLLAGAGWTWPTTAPSPTSNTPADGPRSPFGDAFWTSLGGVLAGHADAGLPALAGHQGDQTGHPGEPGAVRPSEQLSGDLAGRGLVWACVAATELLLVGLLVLALIAGYRRWGPGRIRGMATATEAEQLLGLTRLTNVAPHIRPDLYRPHRDRSPRRTSAPEDQRLRGSSSPAPAQPPDGEPAGTGAQYWYGHQDFRLPRSSFYQPRPVRGPWDRRDLRRPRRDRRCR